MYGGMYVGLQASYDQAHSYYDIIITTLWKVSHKGLGEGGQSTVVGNDKIKKGTFLVGVEQAGRHNFA